VTAAIGGSNDPVDLVDRARSGDADAFATLIASRERAMGRLAMAILGNAADADDALQEALTSIWTGLPRLRDADRFGVWADRIVVNACRLVLRRRARARSRHVDLALIDEERLVGHELAFDERLARRAAVDRAFGRLDPEARAILALHHLDDRPLGEIAAILGIPLGTVKSRLHTARKALEHAMTDELR
jgi:RNA polymerase sigma-70 factor (ECF subfamily)